VPAMRTREVVALGIGQCVNWGVLYYAFGVLVLPVEAALGVPPWIVMGAFSLALFMSAVLAPLVGRWSDRGHGALVMETGGFMAAGLLLFWALVPTVTTLYVAWAGLGLCMAAILYEPAFAIVGRAHEEPAARLRALAAVTIFGGLASTVFLPLTAFLVRGVGWRAAIGVLAMVLAASTAMMRVCAFPRLRSMARGRAAQLSAPISDHPNSTVPQFSFVLVAFSLASLASAAFTTNLIAALAERDVSPTTAAMLGGLLGVMQLPGRALLMNGSLAASPARLVFVTFVLQGIGLASIALASSNFVVAGGIIVFAAGAGLTTLVRPHLVQSMCRAEVAGYVNGRLARWQQLARAFGPILIAWLATGVGYGVVFGLLAAVFAVLALASTKVLHGSRSSIVVERSRHDGTANATTIGG
jgi:MFS family permease